MRSTLIPFPLCYFSASVLYTINDELLDDFKWSINESIEKDKQTANYTRIKG